MLAARLATRTLTVKNVWSAGNAVITINKAAWNMLHAVPASSYMVTRSPVFTRNFWNGSKNDAQDPEEIIRILKENPEIRTVLEEFQLLLKSKGVDGSKTPSITEMVKLFSQKDVRDMAQKLQLEFQKAGINITPANVGLLMDKFKQ